MSSNFFICVGASAHAVTVRQLSTALQSLSRSGNCISFPVSEFCRPRHSLTATSFTWAMRMLESGAAAVGNIRTLPHTKSLLLSPSAAIIIHIADTYVLRLICHGWNGASACARQRARSHISAHALYCRPYTQPLFQLLASLEDLDCTVY